MQKTTKYVLTTFTVTSISMTLSQFIEKTKRMLGKFIGQWDKLDKLLNYIYANIIPWSKVKFDTPIHQPTDCCTQWQHS